MENRLRCWIESEEMPTDFYELLGLARLESDRTSIEAAVHAAYRFIHPYQNHRDSLRAERAQQLQMLLGDVCNTISDRDKWREYDEHLIQDLCEQYASHNGRDIRAWKSEGLRRWLSAVKKVHPDRVDGLVKDFLATDGGTAQQPQPEKLLDDDAVSRLKHVFRLSVRPPNPHLTTARIYPQRSPPEHAPKPNKPASPQRPVSTPRRRPGRPEAPSPTGPGVNTSSRAFSSVLGCVAVVLIVGFILTVFAAGLGVLAWVAVR